MIRKMLVLLITIAFFPAASSAQSPGTSKEAMASHVNVLGSRSRPDSRWEKAGVFGGYSPEQEVLEKRSRTTKHFSNSDGTTTAQIMPGGIHYMDFNGAWQDIDMAIAVNPDINSSYKYVNLNNEVKSFFPATAGTVPMKLQSDGHLIFEWWHDPKYFHKDKDGNIVKEYLPQAQIASVSSDSKSLTYPGIYPNITEEFVVVNGGVENNTIVHALSPDIAKLSANGRIEFSQFIPLKSGWEVVGNNGQVLTGTGDLETGSFSIEIPNLEERINFGEIVVFDHSLNKEEVLNIIGLPAEKRKSQQQLLLDNHVYRGSYKIFFVPGGIEVISSIGAGWLQSPDRIFPVTIDPTVTIGTTTTASPYAPITQLWGYQRNADLYLQSEVGIYGNITAIEYYKTNTDAARTKPTKVWMRTSTSTGLASAAWNSVTYTGGLTPLLDANTTQDNTTGWKMITLTTPFSYTADNLLVMVKSDYGGSGSIQNMSVNGSVLNRSAILYQDYTDPPETNMTLINSSGTLKLADIRITYTTSTPVTCAAPTVPTATAITMTTASLNWTQSGTPPQWQIIYGPAGFNVNTAGTSIFTPTKPYILNPPLTLATSYDYYVRAVCGPNDTSAWSPVTNFTTLCIPPTIVSKTDSFNCGPGAVVLKATASSGGSIKWYAALTGGTALFTGDVFTTPLLTASATYYIAAVSGTCESTPRQTVIADIRPMPVVNIGNDTTICPGTTYTLDAGTPGASYAWNTGASTQTITVNTTGNYSVLVSLNGCNNSDARVITAGVVPQNILPATTDLCEGATTTLNAGNSGSTFLWTPGSETTQTVNVTAGGTKSVTIRSTTGCVLTSSTDVLMRPLPVVDLGNDTSICNGAQFTLDAGNSSDSHLWSPSGATTQTIIAADSGTYTVTVSTSFNCESTDSKHVAYLQAPRVDGFNFIPLFNEDLGKVKFEALNPISVTSYLWNFGDGSATSTQTSPTHTYAASGAYAVILKVFNDCGEYETSMPINVDLTTGMVTLDKQEANIVLYPNPSTSVLTIDNRSADLKLKEVTIFNILGAVVYKDKLSGNNQKILVGNLASGSYYMSILTDKGFVIRKFEVLK